MGRIGCALLFRKYQIHNGGVGGSISDKLCHTPGVVRQSDRSCIDSFFYTNIRRIDHTWISKIRVYQCGSEMAVQTLKQCAIAIINSHVQRIVKRAPSPLQSRYSFRVMRYSFLPGNHNTSRHPQCGRPAGSARPKQSNMITRIAPGILWVNKSKNSAAVLV